MPGITYSSATLVGWRSAADDRNADLQDKDGKPPVPKDLDARASSPCGVDRTL